MKANYKNAQKEEIKKGIFRIWLIDKTSGAKNFYMRVFEILPSCSTQEDKHAYEHEIFVLSGHGKLKIGDKWEDMEAGDAFYVPCNALHSIKNEGDEILRFICIVPSSYYKQKKKER